VLLRRLDRVEVIGSALTAAAAGRSFRTISRELGLPPTTVRDWIRRFVARTAAHPSLPGAAGTSGSADPAPDSPPSPQTLSALVTAVPSPSSSPGRVWRDANLASCGQLLI
jgi:transposase-like protein